MKTYRTRKAAVQAAYEAIKRDGQQRFVITHGPAGSTRRWTVTGIAPIGQELFYGPFRSATHWSVWEQYGVNALADAPLPAWIGAPIK